MYISVHEIVYAEVKNYWGLKEMRKVIERRKIMKKIVTFAGGTEKAEGDATDWQENTNNNTEQD